MIQGGDPNTKADAAAPCTGGPGYQIKAEFNDRPHVRGMLSMARSNDPDSAGRHFFICHGDPDFLDHQYTAFGKLIKGDDVLEKIATTPTHPGDRPVTKKRSSASKSRPPNQPNSLGSGAGFQPARSTHTRPARDITKTRQQRLPLRVLTGVGGVKMGREFPETNFAH